jgi:hypothetical protein
VQNSDKWVEKPEATAGFEKSFVILLADLLLLKAR